jgi:hypothetical protein
MTNKLSSQDIDRELIDRDQHKPVRKLVDGVLAPIANVGMAGGAAVVKALGSIKTINNLHTIA